MPQVKFTKENIVIETAENSLLLDAIRSAGLALETPCNGLGSCGKCRVIARGGLSEPDDREKQTINGAAEERLSCMARVRGDVEVELLAKPTVLKTINKGYSIHVAVDSPVQRLRLPEIDRTSPRPFVEQLGLKIPSLDVWRKLTEVEELTGQAAWGVVFEDQLLDVTHYQGEVLGVSIDIGTTGISYYLLDLTDGSILGSMSSLNPQTEYGGDVLTRIAFCMEDPAGAIKLQKLIIDEINDAIKKLTGRHRNVKTIYHLAIAANTTMLHLLLGIDPRSLARAPYRPVFLNCAGLKAKDLKLQVCDDAVVTIIPSVSSYVGGDITAGILASGFRKNKVALFIDIGTNGELAALFDGRIIATSTAAGPALEGMNIECGTRAVQGAIERFDICQDGQFTIKTIGGTKPIGICGSGLIDIVGALVKNGIVEKSGRWNKNADPRLAEHLRDKRFFITEDIYISQKDIRQIQLAKGAIAAGLILLLKAIGLSISDIPLIYIAGAFGYHINPEHIKL